MRTRLPVALARLAALTTLATLVACHDGGPTAAQQASALARSAVALALTGEAPAGGHALAVTPSELTVVRGADVDAAASVTIARAGFPGAVRLTAAGVPAGVTLAIPSGPLRGDAASLTVRTTESATPGEYRVTLTGTADGHAPVTTTLALRVLDGGATFDIGMGRRPPGSPIVMAAGTELGQWDRPTIGIKRTCAECEVTLEATGAPAGITVTFAPSGAGRASNPAVLTRYNGWAEPRVAVAAGVRDGDYPVTLTATAGAYPPVAATLVIRVASAGYALAVTPATTVVAAGGGPVSAALRALPSSGFADGKRDLKIAASGVPAGVAVGLADVRYLGLDPGYPLHFTVQADASVPPGDYPVVIHSAVNDGRPTPVDTSASGAVTTTIVVRVISPTQDPGFVPDELAGGFQTGVVSLLSFWNSHTGDYVGRNGYLASFTFERDGTYRLLVYSLKRGSYGCTTEVWSEYAGAVTFGEGTFETRPTSGRYKVADSCFGNFYQRVASSADLEANSRTWHWAWERHAADGKTYLRIGFDLESRESWNWFARTDGP
jgi:hypothetical protein